MFKMGIYNYNNRFIATRLWVLEEVVRDGFCQSVETVLLENR